MPGHPSKLFCDPFSLSTGQLVSRQQTHLRFYASFEAAPANPCCLSFPFAFVPSERTLAPSRRDATEITDHETRVEWSIWYLNKRTYYVYARLVLLRPRLQPCGTSSLIFFFGNTDGGTGCSPWIFITRGRVRSIKPRPVNMLIEVIPSVHRGIKTDAKGAGPRWNWHVCVSISIDRLLDCCIRLDCSKLDALRACYRRLTIFDSDSRAR